MVEINLEKKPVMDMNILAEALSLKGHNVYAIDYGDNIEYQEKDISRVFKDAVVHLIRPPHMALNVMNRASAFVSHYFAVKNVIKTKQIDAIVLYSAPTNGWQTIHWAKYFEIPVIFRSIDILNQLVPYPVLRPFTKMAERYVYSRVDRILTLSPKLSEYVVKLGAKRDKVGVLPMPVDTSLFRPLENPKEIRHKWGLKEDDFVLLFMGTLFDFSGLDDFIKELHGVASYLPKLKLMIVGDGQQRRKLESMVDNLKLRKSVVFTGFQPYTDMPLYINASDICINTFVINDTTRDIFPGKIAQFLACGKPVLATKLDGMVAVVAGENQGVVYANNSDDMITRVIDLLEAPDRRRHLGQRALEYAKRVHSYENVARQLEVELRLLI